MDAFPLTILVCSCLPYPSVIRYRTSKVNRALHLDLLSLLTHCPWVRACAPAASAVVWELKMPPPMAQTPVPLHLWPTTRPSLCHLRIMSLTMLSPQSSSAPPCPLSVRGPPSIPHVQSPHIFIFFIITFKFYSWKNFQLHNRKLSTIINMFYTLPCIYKGDTSDSEYLFRTCYMPGIEDKNILKSINSREAKLSLLAYDMIYTEKYIIFIKWIY